MRAGAIVLGTIAGFGIAPAWAACRLALLLALDVSASVDAREDALQRAGLAAALRAPEVQEALLAVPEAPVALAVYEWSGRQQQHLVLPWQMLGDAGAIEAAAATIAGSERRFADMPTAMGFAIGHAATVFRAAPPCLMQVLDISGDGLNNEGFGPALAYANFPLDGVTVNGLAIGGAGADSAGVIAFYRNEVIRGPGAFLEVAQDFDDFARAMRRKLAREAALMVIGAAGPPAPPPRR